MFDFKGRRAAKVLLPLFFVCLALAWWLQSLLLVVGDAAGTKSFSYSCHRGDVFRIRLIHSVEKTPWEDSFLILGAGDLLLTTSKFESLGWGYPYSPADGKFSIDKDQKFLVTMNRPFADIRTCISIQARPKFLFKEESLDLCREFGDGEFLRIQVIRRYQWFMNLLNLRR